MRRLRQARRPLVALVALVLLLAIGYGVRACDDSGGHAHGTGAGTVGGLSHTGERALRPAPR